MSRWQRQTKLGTYSRRGWSGTEHEAGHRSSSTAEAPWDSLNVSFRLRQVDQSALAALEEFIVSWHRVGVLGGFGGTVHDASIRGLSEAADGTPTFDVVLDLGSADQAALDVFLRGVRGVVIHDGLAVEEVVLGWPEGD